MSILGQGYSSIPRDGLAGEWLLNGNANDNLGVTDGSASNVTWNTFDEIKFQKQYGTFNGTTSTIDTNYSATDAADWSRCIWFRYDTGGSISAAQRFWCSNNGGSDKGGVQIGHFQVAGADQGKLFLNYFNTSNAYQYILSTASVFDGLWHFLSGQLDYSTNTLYLYLDGVLNNSGVKTGTIRENAYNDTLGRTAPYDGGGGNYFQGDLYGARFYTRLLTASEVLALYLEGLGKLGQY